MRYAVLILMALLAGGLPATACAAGTYRQITQETAKEMMGRDDGHVVVDVRRQDEYDAGHIPGAILIPNESIAGTKPEQLPDLNQIILIYCRSGRRSKEAAQKLADMGYENIYEFGGIIDWTGEVVQMKTYEATNVIQVNGVTLHYAVAGEGRPVLLIHGNGEDHHLFDVEIDQLVAAGYRVYAPDSRGHGANEPLEEYHYADMAEDMYQFIQALGLEKPALYGFSDGGIIGLMLAIKYPDCLGVLAVSGANLSPEGMLPSFLEEYTAINERVPTPLFTLMLTEPHIDPESLRGIRIPVLVTAGENDLVLREETDRIAEMIPGARKVILEGHDHGSYIANSDVMGRLLIDFLSGAWTE